jgi:hypothetical protein
MGRQDYLKTQGFQKEKGRAAMPRGLKGQENA